MGQRESPVLMTGGGPVGLVLSILLSLNGIDHILVEARATTSAHPKARGISARSMEILRRAGLEAEVRGAGLPAEHVSMYRGTSLVDPDFVRTTVTPPAGGQPAVTPSAGVICSQDVLESLLLTRARELAGDRVRFGHRLLSLEQGRPGVRAVVKSIADESVSTVESDYLVGCDGAGSTVRQQSGIAMDGPTGLRYYVSVRFRASLGAVVADRASASYFLTPPGRGGFMAVDNDTRWIYQYPYDPATEHPADFGDAQWVALIRAAAGVDDLDVDVVDTMEWRMDACLADAYRRGAVLLAGDAAHLTPPTGGHGMNVGIGDADNLAWKLAAVVAGRAGPGLLDTYELERRPIAAQVIDIATGNAHSRGNYRIDDELLLTAAYVSPAVVSADGYRPTAVPGHRLPHMWLDGPPGGRSTLDLVDTGFVLLHGAAACEWSQRADEAARLGVPVTDHALPRPQWAAFAQLCQLPDAAALLVRPDGHIAWRADSPPLPGILPITLGGLFSR